MAKNNWMCSSRSFIIDASLKKNIAFGLPDEEIDIKKINQSIEAANLSNLVRILVLELTA